MSQQNVEAVRRAWDAWLRGDLPGVFTYFDPEVVWDTSHFHDWPEAAYHGIDGVERFLTEWLEVWADYEMDVDDVIAAPDGRVVSLLRQRGRGRDSGIPMEMSLAQIATLRDGRVTRLDNYEDQGEALRDAGLDPQQVVRAMHEALSRGDAQAALDAFHPDVEWDGRNIPDGALRYGRQAVLDHASHWASIWADWTIDVERLEQVGTDTVIAYTRERGRSETGVEMDERHAEVYVVRDGKIVRRVAFSDPAEALPAVSAPSWSSARTA